MQVFRIAKTLNRSLMPVMQRISGDDKFHHRLAYPFAAGLSFLPGDRGLYFGEIARHLDKRRRSAGALRAFEDHVARLGTGSMVIDLGANVGVFTERLAMQGAQVHAFEPDPWTFEKLHARVGAMPNVVVHNKAVGARTERLRFHRDPDFDADPASRSLGGTLLDRQGFGYGQSFDVEVIRLTDFLRTLDRDIALIKMDIEGAELEVLKDLLASPCLNRLEAIFVETHINLFPEQILPMAHLRKDFAARPSPHVNFDWH